MEKSYAEVLLEQIRDGITTQIEMTGKRTNSENIAYNNGAGTDVKYTTPFALDDSFELFTEARDSNGRLVTGVIILGETSKDGFTAIPPAGTIGTIKLKYTATLKN